MSSPRLLLVSGAPGSGASSVARACALAARTRGERAEILTAADMPAPPALVDLLGSWDPLLGEAVAALPAMRTAQGLLAAAAAVEDGSAGAILWDAGPIDALLADLAALDALGVAASRVSGTVVAIAASIAGERLAVARRLQADVERALDLLRGPDAAMVIVEEPTPGLRARVRAVRARAALLGLPVDLLVVNRVPRRRDGWPGAWTRERRRRADRARDLGPSSCEVRWVVDDADDAGVVRRIAKRLPEVPVRVPADDVVMPRELDIDERDGGYALRIPMPHADPATVRAGRLGDVLVIEVAGLRRLIALPPVLIRCTVDGGGIVGDDLVLRFSPDPAQWRSAS